MLTVAGLHVPVIPSIEVAGSAGTVPPSQMVSDVPKPNVGVMLGRIVTVSVVLVTHCPGVGVKVYTPKTWLLTVAGLQVPAIPLVEVLGKAGATPPWQIANTVPKVNVGVTLGITVTFIVDDNPH